jgi:glycosyltransferase involved in cell wall biosynthesis
MNSFSIITVVRNDLVGLQKSRNSLNIQTNKNWTHIIIDGASTDGTLDFLKTLSEENTIYVSEPDTGIYNAMNKGWKLAKPESLVFYLNARDIFATPSSLEEANLVFEKNQSSNWGCTTHEEIEQNGEGWICKLVGPPSINNQLYAFGYRSHQAVVMKANFIENLGGFNETYKLAADWDLIVKAINKESPIVWWNSLAKFELGGISSDQLLEAHLELQLLRKKYLTKNLKGKIAENIWCALYLRNLGYRNRWSGVISFLFKERKNNNFKVREWKLKKKISYFLQKYKRNTGKYKLVGKFMYLTYFLLSIINIRLNIMGNIRSRLIKKLRKNLGILEYYSK